MRVFHGRKRKRISVCVFETMTFNNVIACHVDKDVRVGVMDVIKAVPGTNRGDQRCYLRIYIGDCLRLSPS